MSSSGIKSKPVYPGLSPDIRAHRHILVGEGEGADALVDLRARFADQCHANRTTESPFMVFYTPGDGPDHSERLTEMADTPLGIYRSVTDLCDAVYETLCSASMGTRMYVAGSEPFLWAIVLAARKTGMTEASIQMERSGPPRRPVCCVHCKTTEWSVSTTIYQCRGCGLHLFVRDHFSRRLGVYQGVCVDAEAPGELPDVEELES